MAEKHLIYGPPKKGKTLYTLSMAKLGPIGLWDLEYTGDKYLRKHPTIPQRMVEQKDGPPIESPTKRAALKPHIAKLLGIPEDTLIYWLQSQDLGMGEVFLKTVGAMEEVVGLGVDSMSVHWDLTSDHADSSKPGGLAWAGPKRMERRLQYALMGTKKHYVITAHLQEKFSSDMKVIGEVPWVEKKMPYWLDFIARMDKPLNKERQFIVKGERSGGLLQEGQVIEKPSFELVMKLNGGNLEEDTPVSVPDEAAVYESNARAVGTMQAAPQKGR